MLAFLFLYACSSASTDTPTPVDEKITISFDTQGGNTIPTQSITKGEKLSTKPSDPTKNNHTFNGWYTAATAGTKVNLDTQTFSAKTTLYARWTQTTFTITFALNGEGATGKPDNQTLQKNNTAIKPPSDPVRTDYNFVGWYQSQYPSQNESAFDFTSLITADMTLYARWTQDFIVTFDTQGGTPIENQTATQGGTATRPDNDPTREGYAFDNWYTMATGGELFDFSKNITSSITVYARWLQQFTLTYHANKPSDAPQDATVTGVPQNPESISEGQTATAPTPPTIANYNFVAWYTEPTTTNPYDFSQGITANIDLYAKWSQDPVVTFDTQGGNNIMSQTITGSVTMATRPDNPTREDYEFNNWFTMATGGELFDFSQTITAQSTTVYAQWTRIMRTITYHGNKPVTAPEGATITGLMPNPKTVTVNSGDTATPPAIPPVLQDYVFQGWFAGTITGTTPTLQSTAFAFRTTTIRGENINLYAKWTRKEITITFYGNKPSTAPSGATITGLTTDPTIITVNSGETITAPIPAPGLTGYTLDGWFRGTILGGVIALQDTAFALTTTTIRGENINLYAKWLQQFTVTYHGNKPSDAPQDATLTGVPDSPVSISDGRFTTATIPAPELTGYNFVAWYTEATATNPYDFSQGITTSIDLYAKWSQDPVVTFDTRGGNNIMSQTITGSVTMATRPDNPTREDYEFNNWFTMATGGELFDFSQAITAQSTTVYAQWTRIMRTITYHGNKPSTAPEGATITGLMPNPKTVTVNSGDTATPPAIPPVLQDYVFQGWFAGTITGTTPMLDNTAFAFRTTTIRGENINLYAKWTRKKITITFYGNKPSTAPEGATITGLTTDPTIITVNSGEKITAPIPAPGLTGYTLDGWFRGTILGGMIALQDTAFAFTTTTIRGENINLYAKWIQQFTVTYHDNKPNDAPQDATVTGVPENPVRISDGRFTTATIPAPELTGYNFVAWYTEPTATNPYDFSQGITANIDLYAKWSQDTIVTFDTQGGNDIDSQRITGTPKRASRPSVNPSRTPHYIFKGWFTTAAGTTEFIFDQDITALRTTVYAQWTRKTYTITFNQNYGNTPTTLTMTTDQEGKVSPPDFSTQRPAAYTAIGWFKTNGGSDKINDFTTEVFNGDITLYAKWGFKPSTKAELVDEINRVITPTTPSPNLNYIDTSQISDMSELFKDKSNFNGDISGWNVSNVKNMSEMFGSALAFNGNISSWNVSNVENIFFMFNNARAFNQNISSWNVAKVTNMEGMFNNARAFNQNISSWNVAKVTKMQNMFNNARVFNQNISSWNVAKVTNMKQMFSGARVFNQNISSWNVSLVQNMSLMFANATVFNQNISSWNVSLVKDMNGMFTLAVVFNQNISSWNVSLVENMESMFDGATAFNQNISSWNVAKVTNMSGMFQDATTFNQNISSWNVSLVENMEGMFDGATAFNQNISSWNVAKVTNMSGMFQDATTFNQNISSWNVSLVKNMEAMFAGARVFNQNISGWNVSLVKNMATMFAGATAFNQNISGWNVSLVDNMEAMFSGAIAFNQNISSWNVSLVKNMAAMFVGTNAFNGNISSWNVSKVTNMRAMFRFATAFNQNISNWSVSLVENMEFMFNGATAFNQNISSWNVAKVTKMSGMFDEATTFNQNISGWNVNKVISFLGFRDNSALSEAHTPQKFR